MDWREKEAAERGRLNDEFAAYLAATLRDPGIAALNWVMPEAPRTPAWLESLKREVTALSAEQQQVVRRCVALAVDEAMYSLLRQLQDSIDYDEGYMVVPFTKFGEKGRVGVYDALHNGVVEKYSQHPKSERFE